MLTAARSPGYYRGYEPAVTPFVVMPSGSSQQAHGDVQSSAALDLKMSPELAAKCLAVPAEIQVVFALLE